MLSTRLAPVAVLVFGCSSSGSGGSTSSGSGSSSSTASGGGSDWQVLVGGNWEIAPGTERYWCVRKTFTETTYVTAFRALAPAGTHHTLLLRETSKKTDGAFACGPTLGSNMVFASGVGTKDLVFPTGVAAKIQAGTQLLLNLHLYNTSQSDITGTSGTLVKTIPASQVAQEAGFILPGNMSIALPPNSKTTINGKCTFKSNATVFAVWPHMHQLGIHAKIEYAGKTTKTLHDAPYSFGEQTSYDIEPLAVTSGDTLRFECTFHNTTPNLVTFGDSSDKEMCFVGLYQYPASAKCY
jgi:hypothetical protein